MALQKLVDKGDRHTTFADRRGDPLDRAATHVPTCKNPRNAGFEKIGIAVLRPAPALHHIRAGQHVSALVPRNLCRQPLGFRVGSDENEKPAAILATQIAAAAIERSSAVR